MAKKIAVVADMPAELDSVEVRALVVIPRHAGGMLGLPQELPARLLSIGEIGTMFGNLVQAGLVQVPVELEGGERGWETLKALEIRIQPPAVQRPGIELQGVIKH